MNKEEMIDSVRNYLSYFGVSNKKILEAMDVIDRKKFYYDEELAYRDIAQPIPCGQTISQPSTVGRMLDLLKLEKGNSVLEIGAGSGWSAALMAYLVKPGKVISLEIREELAECARKNSSGFHLENLEIDVQSFHDVLLTFDRIIFTCGIEKIQEKKISNWIKKHLNNNGRAICPFKEGPLIIFEKKNNELTEKYTKEEYCFVPLI